ncbi:MAG: hypothetical protein QM723_28575 [Myxococcaceae bacterium]
MNAALRIAFVVALTPACAPSVKVPAAAHLSKGDGDLQTGLAGQALAIGPSVLLTGPDGKPVAGVPVGCQVISKKGGSVGLEETQSGPDGVATCGAWTLGNKVGLHQLQVYANGVDPVVFSAAALDTVSTFELTIQTPETSFNGTNLEVVVKTVDNHRVSSVAATFADQTAQLEGFGGNQESTFSGAIDVSSLQIGSVGALIVRASDDHFGIAEAALLLTFDLAPQLVVANPALPLSFSPPVLQLSATASSDSPVTISANANGTMLAQGTDILLATVDLSAFEGQIVPIVFTATDALGSTATVTRSIWVSTNPHLQPTATVSGQLIDFDGKRALHAAGGDLLIADFTLGTDVDVSAGTPPAALSPQGAVACDFEDSGGTNLLIEDLLTLLPRGCEKFDVEGPWVFYTSINDQPFIADLEHGQVVQVSTNGALSFSLAPTGDAVFSDITGHINHATFDGGTYPLQVDVSDGSRRQAPSTDGHLIAYLICFNSGCPSLGVWDGQETRITPALPPTAVWVNDGWLLWTNQSQELWEQQVHGAPQQLDATLPIALLPAGTVVAANDTQVLRIPPGGPAEPILVLPVDQPFPKVVQRDGRAWFLLEGLAVEVLP